jgi:hypothetical protein
MLTYSNPTVQRFYLNQQRVMVMAYLPLLSNLRNLTALGRYADRPTGLDVMSE